MSHLNQQMITVDHHEKSSPRIHKSTIKDTEERKETSSNLNVNTKAFVEQPAERESIDFDDASVHKPPLAVKDQAM